MTTQEVSELPPNLISILRKIRACESEVTAQLVLETFVIQAVTQAAADAQRWQFVKKHRPAVLCSIAWFWGSATKDAVANDPDKAMDAAMSDEAMRQGAQQPMPSEVIDPNWILK